MISRVLLILPLVATQVFAAWELHQPSRVAGLLFGAAYFEGQYWLTHVDDDQIMYSHDLVNWQVDRVKAVAQQGANIPVGGYLKRVGDRLYLLGSHELIMKKSAGTGWHQVNIGPGGYSINDVTYGNGRWLAVGGYTASQGGTSTIAVSTDGEHWETEHDTFPLRLMSVEYIDGEFVVGGGHFETGGWVFRSSDLKNWRMQHISAYTVSSVIKTIKGWVATTGTHDSLYGSILYSADGESWIPATPEAWQSPPPGSVYRRLNRVVSYNDGFVVIGGRVILRSEDGRSWRAVVRVPDGMEFYGITEAPGGLVAVGNGGMIFTSTDGVAWQDGNRALSLPDDGRLLDIAHGIFRSTVEGLTYSDDGKSWIQVPTPSFGDYFAIAQVVSTGDRLFGMSGLGAIVESRNGRAWQEVLAGESHVAPLYRIAWWQGELWGVGPKRVVRGTPEEGFVTISNDGYNQLTPGDATLLMTADRSAILFRADGTSVKPNLGIGPNAFIGGVAYGAGRYVMTGQGLDPDESAGHVTVTSEDGIHWILHRNAPREFRSIDFGAGIFRAADFEGTIWKSFDGVHWALEAELNIDGLTVRHVSEKWICEDNINTVFTYEPELPARSPGLANFSGLSALEGGRTTIAGFVIGGQREQEVLVRTVGPDMAHFGVEQPLADPEFSVIRHGDGQRIESLTVGDATSVRHARIEEAARTVGAFPLTTLEPGVNADLFQLAPGPYSVHARSHSKGSGQVLVEVYALAPESSGIFNASLRVWAAKGKSPAIVGFVSSGARSYLFRGVGDTLRDFGVSDAASTLSFTGFNTDDTSAFSSIQLGPLLTPAMIDFHTRRSGAFTLKTESSEPSVLTTRAAGATTIHLHPDDIAGEVLFEIYLLP